MLHTNRRGTLVLYSLLGLVVLTLIFTSAVAPAVGGLLLLGYAGLVFLTSRRWRLTRRKKPARKGSGVAITRAARDSLDRIPRSSSLLPDPFVLQDIGLVVDERRSDGIALRRARFMSLDDESLRPYIVMHFSANQYPQQVLIRFEITDAGGEKQYVYEMQHLLRPGENLIMPNYRLPVTGNSRLSRSGAWDLSITIDGKLVAMHQFDLLPSLAERMKQVSADGEVSHHTRLVIEEQDEFMPVSLEDLLRGRSRS